MKRQTKLIMAITVVAILAVVSAVIVMASGTASEPMSVDYCSLSLRDSVVVKYAVKNADASTQLLVWNTARTEYSEGTQSETLSTVGTQEIGGVTYYVYDLTSLRAKNMADNIYVRAYKDGEYSPVVKYSILQYAYDMLGKTADGSTNESLKQMLNDMLAYGGSAQVYLDYNIARTASMSFYQVKLTDGYLADTMKQGLYLAGEKIVLTAPETDSEGESFSYWSNGNEDTVSTDPSFTLTVGSENEVYTPVYGDAQIYSEGLEYESNGDGTCVVLGMGTCTDTDVVIPAVYNGESVIGIEASAFNGEEITSITLPKSIEYIARRAFNGCTALTDVYYKGTEDEWNAIDLSTYNTPLENAAKHFASAPVVTYTVTFKGYDGAVLKTETVNSGSGATPPTAPDRDGFTFTGWDKEFDNITADTEVTAQYAFVSSEPTIIVNGANASVGETVNVAVDLYNNPGIPAMQLSVEYDESVMTLKSITNGTAMACTGMNFTAPKGEMVSGSNITWFVTEVPDDEIVDGTLMTLTFDILPSATSGASAVSIAYEPGLIVDNAMTPVDMVVINGNITVE